jgi:hypothetical protein
VSRSLRSAKDDKELMALAVKADAAAEAAGNQEAFAKKKGEGK